MDERKRDSMVAYLRRRMAEFDIEPEDIARSLADDEARFRQVRYRDAFGQTWDGKGTPPQWVVQATSAGQALEHFAIDETAALHAAEAPARTGVDWRDDPFAGTRLASGKAAAFEAHEAHEVRERRGSWSRGGERSLHSS